MSEIDHHNIEEKTGKPEVSIVIPLYNECESISELVQAIQKEMESIHFEVIIIDDGSNDGSWEEILKLSGDYDWIRAVSFQRNYGKSTALQIGFDMARGSVVVTMDADLQDDPSEILPLVEMIRSGYDLVSGWKKKRKDPLIKRVSSRFFNFVTRWMTGIKLHDFNCGLKAYRAEVVKKIRLYGELHRYVPLLASWEGYDNISEKVVTHHPRKYGTTKFGLSRFIHGFLDLLTILFVNNYMSRPMHFFGTLGILTLIAGSSINLYMAWLKLVEGVPLANRPLLFLGIMLVVVGVQFFSIGFLGDMINKGQESHRDPNIREQVRG